LQLPLPVGGGGNDDSITLLLQQLGFISEYQTGMHAATSRRRRRRRRPNEKLKKQLPSPTMAPNDLRLIVTTARRSRCNYADGKRQVQGNDTWGVIGLIKLLLVNHDSGLSPLLSWKAIQK
jgi:hypothetical protein